MYVYFIQTTAPGRRGKVYRYKIGVAADVAARLIQLQTGCPSQLQLFGVLRCQSRAHAFDVEQRLHALFAHKRVCGEWFRVSNRMALALRRLIHAWPLDRPLEEFMQIAVRGTSNAKTRKPHQIMENDERRWGLPPIDTLNRSRRFNRLLTLPKAGETKH